MIFSIYFKEWIYSLKHGHVFLTFFLLTLASSSVLLKHLLYKDEQGTTVSVTRARERVFVVHCTDDTVLEKLYFENNLSRAFRVHR